MPEPGAKATGAGAAPARGNPSDTLSPVFMVEFAAARLPHRLLTVFIRNAELLKFLTVGGIAFITTTVLFFGLKWTILYEKPVTANIVATLIATVVSYILNREWAFTARGGRERRHEAALFFVVAGLGAAITQLPLVISRYVCQLQIPHVSVLTENIADFLSATVLGTLLATAFRWWAMRKYVFPHTEVPALQHAEQLQPTQE